MTYRSIIVPHIGWSGPERTILLHDRGLAASPRARYTLRWGQWWIGGSPCSGKSTVASIVAARRNALVYSCDDAFERHAAAIQSDAGPTLKKVTAMSVEDRLNQPVEVQVDDAFRVYHEEFPLIVHDLAGVGAPRVVEGAALLPELLAAIDVPRDRAVWIVPTEEFQVRHYGQRMWARDLLAGAADPQAAFARWMRRDAIFARTVAGRARALGYRVFTVDGATGAAGIAAAVDDFLT
jgi:hypothetical protein